MPSERPLTHSPAGGPRSWLVFLIGWLGTAALMVCWVFATPIAASPDEPAHAVKAASVVRGELLSERTNLGSVVSVPRYVASMHAETCFAREPELSADCSVSLEGDPAEIIESTTTAGLYNPVYYALVGWPTLIFQDTSGVYAMRVVSALLASLFVGLTALLVNAWASRRAMFAALAIAAPPMLYFLGASINPNALEVTATLAAFVAMLSVLLLPDDRLLPQRAAILAVAASVAVNTRGLSALWVAIAVLVPMLLVPLSEIGALFRRRAVIIAAAATVLATAFSFAWLLGSASLTAPLGDEDAFQQYQGVGESALAGFRFVLANFVGFAQGMIGVFGWLDTPADPFVYLVWAGLSGGLLLLAVSAVRRRQTLFVVALALAFVFLPAIIQGAYIHDGGIIWQGRYALVLFAMAVVGFAAVSASRLSGLAPRQRSRVLGVVWIGWAVSQLVAFAPTLKRYIVGADATWLEFLERPQWNAPLGNITLVVAAALVTIAVAFLAWRVDSRRAVTAPATTEASVDRLDEVT